ncbi:hypothetical protein DFH11DRAFT_856240 [Phellopilus nigrolimitatus]|nr:hypothetical protein DFH11DRAFT_856240 [Phellopilus nigrolimitatus]
MDTADQPDATKHTEDPHAPTQCELDSGKTQTPVDQYRIQTAEPAVQQAVPNTSDELLPLGEFRLYKAPVEGSRSSTIANLPSEFFDPTSADLKSAQATLSARAKTLQEAPLLTEKLRNEKDQARRGRWPTATVRIKFADRSLLEKSFPSTDQIKSVYMFTRACLREDVRVHKFVLYVAPPRRDLRVSDPAIRDKSLYDLRLVPQSILYFRFLEDDVKLDLPTGPPPLLPAILSRTMDLPATQIERLPNPAAPDDPEVPTTPDTKSPAGTASEKKIANLLKLTSESVSLS